MVEGKTKDETGEEEREMEQGFERHKRMPEVCVGSEVYGRSS